MTPDAWISMHPYLRPLAALHAVMNAVPIEASSIPAFDGYRADFCAGVPLLQSRNIKIDLSFANRAIACGITRFAAEPSIGNIAEQARELQGGSSDPGLSDRTVDWLLDGESLVPAHPGLLRWLGWSMLARSLSQIMNAFAIWRDDEKWLRDYCPGCGTAAAMAQLVSKDPARARLLSCGCCKTRWYYLRARCPFCHTQHDRGRPVLEVQVQGELRIDYCDDCGAYIKTYNGQGSEDVFLADWTSIHLDVLARERGLIRQAASLYEI